MKTRIITYCLAALAAYLALQLFLKSGQGLGVPATLPDNIKHETVIQDSKVITTKRLTPAVPGGKEKIVREEKYLPPEGSAAVRVDLAGNTKVEVKDKGFTFTPAAFLLAGSEAGAGLGARLLYWDKFGLGAGAAVSLAESRAVAPFAFADMRLPAIGFNNAAAGIFVKPKCIGVSLAVYFK